MRSFIHRIYIISHYGSGKGVGLRFNFMGCFLSDERKAAQVCNTTIPADTAITELRGRHFAIDTTMDYVYFCEFSNDV
ncbi:hypothetical protein SK128_024610 [Halocaridina rubra]|uniref:Uncharacterized protein n=1 Tax=Halocaridina rubra TaxID=373956 RepID=A0AAN8ZZT2_HALRR